MALVNTSLSCAGPLNLSQVSDLNCTVTELPSLDCGSSTLSAGSATFLLIALALGCLTQPNGSLILPGCDRIWRLHPLFSIAEAAVIAMRLVSSRLHGTPLRIKAHALLAERLGNVWNRNLWQKQQALQAAPTREELAELLDAVEDMERGSTLRPAVILPMVLQFGKLCFIRGTSLTTALGMLYFFSWLLVETLLLMVHGPKLYKGERRVATRELLRSVCRANVVSNRSRGAMPLARPTVAEEAEALMAEFVEPDFERPVVRVTYRSFGKPRLEGGGTLFYQWYLGVMIWVGDAYIGNILYFQKISFTADISLWIIFPILILGGFGLGMAIELGIASVLRAVWVWWDEKNTNVTQSQLSMSWIAFRTMLIWLAFYILWYEDAGTFKPAWLDWLG
ncbi:hypothetical protein B0H10DRAFT_2429290 [Mycena sp. CBHHK59/15]|nr:hypothetical protein B0H10DRAFT_2429290 [Mycena sp. CBHHK59/15]